MGCRRGDAAARAGRCRPAPAVSPHHGAERRGADTGGSGRAHAGREGMTRAPDAIRAAGDRIVANVPGAVFSGIVGDAAHVYGYHLGRDDLPADDYSVQLDLDQQGPGDAASALDISMPTDQMIVVSHRLANAALSRDPRMRAVREFAGTRDGRNVEAMDIAQWQVEHGWDESHLWHVHI